MVPSKLTDLHVANYLEIPPPEMLWREIPITERANQTVTEGRDAIRRILDEEDYRKIVVVGPCSMSPNIQKELEVALMFRELAEEVSDEIILVYRTYLEKPRTRKGWPGLIREPRLDGLPRRAEGLRLARQFLIDVLELGLPTAMEFVNTRTPQSLDGLIVYGCIGARYVESGDHRALASGLTMPVGIKNGTSGDVESAIDGVVVAHQPDVFGGGITPKGLECEVETRGNPYVHTVLRGGTNGKTNYDADSIKKAQDLLIKNRLKPWVLVDCSHGNSKKNYQLQPGNCRNVLKQMVGGGNNYIAGVMMEANHIEGTQEVPSLAADRATFDKSILVPGKSITDSCISFETARELLLEMKKELKAYRQQCYERK